MSIFINSENKNRIHFFIRKHIQTKKKKQKQKKKKQKKNEIFLGKHIHQLFCGHIFLFTVRF